MSLECLSVMVDTLQSDVHDLWIWFGVSCVAVLFIHSQDVYYVFRDLFRLICRLYFLIKRVIKNKFFRRFF